MWLMWGNSWWAALGAGRAALGAGLLTPPDGRTVALGAGLLTPPDGRTVALGAGLLTPPDGRTVALGAGLLTPPDGRTEGLLVPATHPRQWAAHHIRDMSQGCFCTDPGGTLKRGMSP